MTDQERGAAQLPALHKQLRLLEPMFAEVMAASGVAPERIIRTIIVSVERNPKLLECTRQSILNAAMTAAILGLEVDGVTGQGYLIPYGGKAQFVPGYKGLNTLAARSGYTINAGIIREGDGAQWQEGTGAFVNIVRKLDNKARMVGAWAVAEAKDRPPIVKVLGIDEILKVKAKSPGANKADSPWNDTEGVGFEAMAEKTVRRRLARSMPLNVFQLAAAIDEGFEERGRYSHIDPEKGPIIEGESSPLADREDAQPDTKSLTPPQFIFIRADDEQRVCRSIEEWLGAIQVGIARISSGEQAVLFLSRNKEIFAAIEKSHPEAVQTIVTSLEELVIAFEKAKAKGAGG